MKDCEFSETQFSFCFTFEFIKRFFPFIPLPIFPNTVKEGRAGGGYDVSINGNIFFQFKIPKYYDIESNFIRKHWNVFSKAYYKIKINTDEKQFELLKDLQNPSASVYYTAPEFHTNSDLANFYDSDSIVSHSALFPIENFPNPGSGHHHLIYDENEDWGMLFSKPLQISKAKLRHPLELFPKLEPSLTIYQQARYIAEIIRRKEFKVTGDFTFNTNRPEQLVKQVYTTLLVDYDIHWYPVIALP